MNYLNSLSQMQPSSHTSSVAAAQLETDTAAVHQQPQGITSNMRLSPLKPCDSDSKKSVESLSTLFFPLPGKQQNSTYYIPYLF